MSSLEEEKVESLETSTKKYKEYREWAEDAYLLNYDDAWALHWILETVHKHFGRASLDGREKMQRLLGIDLIIHAEDWASWDGHLNPDISVPVGPSIEQYENRDYS